MGFLLLWLAEAVDTDAILHHSREFKAMLAMPEYHEERKKQRDKAKDNPDLADVWEHPILSKKWEDVLEEMVVLDPPFHIITSGSTAPLHSHKNIVIITLGTVESRNGARH